MSEGSDKSAGISRRRELLENVFETRCQAVATTPAEDRDPGFNSPRWPLGAGVLVGRATQGSLEERRAAARDLGVLALAWLESIDTELNGFPPLPADAGAGRQDDVVGDGP